jgi:hypothetical protein
MAEDSITLNVPFRPSISWSSPLGVDHTDDRHLADPEFLGHFVKHQFPTVMTLTLTIRQ